MRTLETNDWILLNSIIYKIYTTESMREMREQFLEQIRMLVDFDSADFYLPSRDGSRSLTAPITFNCDQDNSQLYEMLDYSRGIMYSGKSLIYRETDIMSDEKREETEYYKKVYRPNNWHYSLQMILARDRVFVGVITLYRCIGKDNFQYDDIFLLDMLKDHLAYRLHQDMKNGSPMEEKLTVTQACEKYELTHQEHNILKMLMAGENNDQICGELTISVNTLKKHILNIYRKLGIRNRVQMFKMIREKE